MDELVERYTNKRVSFRFAGVSLELALSQGLFSSFDVDAGTKFLLRVVAGQVDLETVSRVADLGCGTGVIGIAVAKKNPQCTCVFQDRDALALAFARFNCRTNGVDERSRFAGGLGLQAVDEGPFDLVLSNLPAKAGLPVLSRMIWEMLDRLRPGDAAGGVPGGATAGGVAAVVIVATLADEIGRILHSLGADIFYTEERREHRVYLFRRGVESAAVRAQAESPTAPAPVALTDAGYLAAYLRDRVTFSHGGLSYDLDTVYNLSDFDTLGREASLAMDVMDKWVDACFFDSGSGSVLIWNPGQGHAAVYLSGRFQNLEPGRFILASRDALSLEITRWNLSRSFDAAAGTPVSAPAAYHAASMDALCDDIACQAAKVSLAMLFLQPIPGTGWEEEAVLLLQRVLIPGGLVIASGGSTEIHRFLSALHGMVLHGSRKYHGSRAVALKNPA